MSFSKVSEGQEGNLISFFIFLYAAKILRKFITMLLVFKIRRRASVRCAWSQPLIMVGLTIEPITMDGCDASDASVASDASKILKLDSWVNWITLVICQKQCLSLCFIWLYVRLLNKSSLSLSSFFSNGHRSFCLSSPTFSLPLLQPPGGPTLSLSLSLYILSVWLLIVYCICEWVKADKGSPPWMVSETQILIRRRPKQRVSTHQSNSSESSISTVSASPSWRISLWGNSNTKCTRIKISSFRSFKMVSKDKHWLKLSEY